MSAKSAPPSPTPSVLQDGLLGREPGGEPLRRVTGGLAVLPLLFGEDPFDEARAPVDDGAHPLDVDEIGSDTDDRHVAAELTTPSWCR